MESKMVEAKDPALQLLLPKVATCQRSGCNKKDCHFFNNYIDPDCVELKRCSKCHQVHYCSVKCQLADWRARHKVECASFCSIHQTVIDIERATTTELTDRLIQISKNCITQGRVNIYIYISLFAKLSFKIFKNRYGAKFPSKLHI